MAQQQHIGDVPPAEPRRGQDVLRWVQVWYRWYLKTRLIPGSGIIVNSSPSGRAISVKERQKWFWGKLTWVSAGTKWEFVELMKDTGAVSTWSVISTGNGGRDAEAVEVNGVAGPTNGYVCYSKIYEELIDNTGAEFIYMFEIPYDGCIYAE